MHNRRASRVGALAAAVTVSLAAVVAVPGSAHASTPAPTGLFRPSTCTTDMHWPGTDGVINAQLAPLGGVAWNIVDYHDNGGLWVGDVTVANVPVDHKNQNYNPHGYVNPIDMKRKAPVHWIFTHIDSSGHKSFSEPGATCTCP